MEFINKAEIKLNGPHQEERGKWRFSGFCYQTIAQYCRNAWSCYGWLSVDKHCLGYNEWESLMALIKLQEACNQNGSRTWHFLPLKNGRWCLLHVTSGRVAAILLPLRVGKRNCEGNEVEQIGWPKAPQIEGNRPQANNLTAEQMMPYSGPTKWRREKVFVPWWRIIFIGSASGNVIKRKNWGCWLMNIHSSQKQFFPVLFCCYMGRIDWVQREETRNLHLCRSRDHIHIPSSRIWEGNANITCHFLM